MLGRDEKAADNAGGHPWIVQDGTESHLLLFNHTASAITFGVSISSGVQIWNKRYQVAPLATRQLSIHQIIADQVKDDAGNTLDPRYHDGVVAWSTANTGEGKGRLLVSNRATAMARNFSCYTTEVVCAVGLSVYDYGMIPLDGYADYADSLPVYCYPAQQGNCSNGTQATGGGATFSWTLGNTSIVNFNTAGDEYSQTPNLRGVATGTTSAYSTVYLNGCYVQAGGNPPPTVPLAPIINSVSPATLPIGGAGVKVTISGSGFGSSPSLNLPSGVSASGQQSTSTNITVTLTASYSASISKSSISVTANQEVSNSAQLILNGPAYATVVSDEIGQNIEGTVLRLVTYHVYNVDSSSVGSIPLAEMFSSSGWSCKNATQPKTNTTACDGSSTTTSGQFTDIWSDYGVYYTPANCGVNVTDHWQWCSPAGPTTGKTFMTLNGYIHTVNSDINNYVNPPNPIPAGTRFTP